MEQDCLAVNRFQRPKCLTDTGTVTCGVKTFFHVLHAVRGVSGTTARQGAQHPRFGTVMPAQQVGGNTEKPWPHRFRGSFKAAAALKGNQESLGHHVLGGEVAGAARRITVYVRTVPVVQFPKGCRAEARLLNYLCVCVHTW